MYNVPGMAAGNERPTSVRGPAPPALGRLLLAASQAIHLAVDEALKAAGYRDVTLAHHIVFQILPTDGERVTVLARRAFVSKQAMSAMVSHLIACGYLEQGPDPRDRRARLVRMTVRGKAMEATARQAIIATERKWAVAVGVERYAEFRRALEAIGGLIDTGVPGTARKG